MAYSGSVPAEEIRAAKAANPKMRARELAASIGVSEAALLAVELGNGVTLIDPRPAALIPAIETLGEVMALTRNESVVHERVGTYEGFRDGPHAALVVGPEIDLRMFPSHWQYGFAVETETDKGVRRSLQVFDAQGDAIHKVHLRDTSDVDAFHKLVDALRLPDQSADISFADRTAPEAPKANPERADELREAWVKMTDTHQFMRLTSRLKMNRLGAYRIAGAPLVRPLAPAAVAEMMRRAASDRIEVMIFVGNRGCIQIHTGPIENIVAMGPWQNVLDPRFDMHLREDHVAEVWLVDKPTQRGPAISIEAFDSEGQLIMQVFGRRTEDGGEAWKELTDSLAQTHGMEAEVTA